MAAASGRGFRQAPGLRRLRCLLGLLGLLGLLRLLGLHQWLRRALHGHAALVDDHDFVNNLQQTGFVGDGDLGAVANLCGQALQQRGFGT